VLVTLRVKNFILMDALELELERGFNVLTGETGAGKSIVVGALSLVLGGRASAEQVRPGADEAEIEALFDVRGSQRLLSLLDASGVSSDGELVVRRVVQQSGRSRAYLNGRLCTAGELQGIASELDDVASQHESVALTDPSTHLGYLDRVARLDDVRAELGVHVAKLEDVVDRIRAAREAERGRGEREAFVAYQLQQIDSVAPRPGELDELAAERNRLRHAGRLLDATRRVASRLYDSEEAICDELARMVSELRAAAVFDPELEATASALDGCWSELSDIARDMARYAERTEADPSRLSEVEERLYRLEGLIRQFGPTLDDVLAARERLAAELASFAGVESRIAELEEERRALLTVAAEHARKLSAKRKKAAERLGTAISGELAELGMGGARVVVDVAPLGGDKGELSIDAARRSRARSRARVADQLVRRFHRRVGHLRAREHARQLCHPLALAEPAHAALRDAARGLLRHDEVRVRERGDRREVGDAQNLVVPRHVGDRAADLVGDRAADAGVDLVEDIEPHRAAFGEHALEREQRAGQLLYVGHVVLGA